MTPSKHKQTRTSRIITSLAIIILAGVVAALGMYAYSYIEGQRAYEKVAEIAFTESPAVDTSDEAAETEPFTLTIDWDELSAINPDVVGWVYLPDTLINYPVVRGRDNDHYLYYDFNGQAAANWMPTFGTPFLLAENARDFSDNNNVIQAHNMANGTMFSKIPELMDTGEFNAHRTVYVLTPEGNYRLTSISMVVSEPYEAILQTSFDTWEEFESYTQGLIDRSVVSAEPAPPPVGEIDRLFMFSTCTSDSGQYRCVLVCTVDTFERRVSVESAGEQVNTQEETGDSSAETGDSREEAEGSSTQ